MMHILVLYYWNSVSSYWYSSMHTQVCVDTHTQIGTNITALVIRVIVIDLVNLLAP